jgi:hypothetical protein
MAAAAERRSRHSRIGDDAMAECGPRTRGGISLQRCLRSTLLDRQLLVNFMDTGDT